MNAQIIKLRIWYIGVCPDFDGIILPCKGKDALHASQLFYASTGWFRGDGGVGYDVKMYGPLTDNITLGWLEEPPTCSREDVIKSLSDGVPVEVVDHQDALRLHADDCRKELENWDEEEFGTFCFFMDQLCWAAYCLNDTPENLLDRKALKWMRSPPIT
jgi:hypothetical protein